MKFAKLISTFILFIFLNVLPHGRAEVVTFLAPNVDFQGDGERLVLCSVNVSLRFLHLLSETLNDISIIGFALDLLVLTGFSLSFQAVHRCIPVKFKRLCLFIDVLDEI